MTDKIKVTRYDINWGYDISIPYNRDERYYDHPEGDWVQYDDIKGLLEELQTLRKLKAEIR